MVVGVSVALLRAWRQRCPGGGRRVCKRLWTSASAKLGTSFSKKKQRRSLRSSYRRDTRPTPKLESSTVLGKHSNSFKRRTRSVTTFRKAPDNLSLGVPVATKTTPHPLDQYIFSTLLKRTKLKRSNSRLYSYRNNYSDDIGIVSFSYNERCIDDCVAAAAEAKKVLASDDSSNGMAGYNSISSASSVPASPPPIPPRRAKASTAYNQNPPPKPFPRASKLRNMQTQLKSPPVKEITYARPRKSRRALPTSTPSSSGVSSGEECTSHNTTRDASSSYMDPKDASEIWQMVVTGDDCKRRVQRVPKGRDNASPSSEEVASVGSSGSWHWCAVHSAQRAKLVHREPRKPGTRKHRSATTMNSLRIHTGRPRIIMEEFDQAKPPLPPKKGIYSPCEY